MLYTGKRQLIVYSDLKSTYFQYPATGVQLCRVNSIGHHRQHALCVLCLHTGLAYVHRKCDVVDYELLADWFFVIVICWQDDFLSRDRVSLWHFVGD